MNQTTTNTQTVVQVKDVPGIMDCILTHKVTDTNGQFKFHVKLDPNEWYKILAFFKWTYDTTKSEAQVRLFVHPEHGWKAWAFPQKANLGMSAKELETHENFAAQRAQFDNSGGGWEYFGTVHHHCSAGAFQSGTDEADERVKDGLHITVGHLDKLVYDLHCRFYKNGFKFIPNMTWFWDPGDYKAGLPQMPSWVKVEIPDADIMARMQMCQPAPEGTEFPQEWRDNIIFTPQPVVTIPHWSGEDYMGSSHGSFFAGRRTYLDRSKNNLQMDLMRAKRAIEDWVTKFPEKERPSLADIFNLLEWLESTMDDDTMNLMGFLCQEDATPAALLMFWKAENEKENRRHNLQLKNGGTLKDDDKSHLDANDKCMDCGYPHPHHGLACHIGDAQSLLQ